MSFIASQDQENMKKTIDTILEFVLIPASNQVLERLAHFPLWLPFSIVIPSLDTCVLGCYF